MLAGGHGGSIVNWSSVGGLRASTFGTSVYAASKAGVISATKSAAVEYGDRGIPGQRHLPRVHPHRDHGGGRRRALPEMFAKAALGRAGEPHEVAEVAPRWPPTGRRSFVSGAIEAAGRRGWHDRHAAGRGPLRGARAASRTPILTGRGVYVDDVVLRACSTPASSQPLRPGRGAGSTRRPPPRPASAACSPPRT